MQTRAVIFDLDGTLVDSLDDITDALAGAMIAEGLAAPGRDAVRRWIGGGARNLIAQAAPPAQVDAVLAGFRTRYHAAPVARTRLFPGMDAQLDRLAAGGAALAVLSNKPHELTVQICAALLGRWPFRSIVGHRAGAPLKPHPAPALAIADELGLAPAACALVGDADTDVATARAAGMRAIAVTWGFRPRAELVAAGPAALIDDPAELPAALA